MISITQIKQFSLMIIPVAGNMLFSEGYAATSRDPSRGRRATHAEATIQRHRVALSAALGRGATTPPLSGLRAQGEEEKGYFVTAQDGSRWYQRTDPFGNPVGASVAVGDEIAARALKAISEPRVPRSVATPDANANVEIDLFPDVVDERNRNPTTGARAVTESGGDVAARIDALDLFPDDKPADKPADKQRAARPAGTRRAPANKGGGNAPAPSTASDGDVLGDLFKGL